MAIGVPMSCFSPNRPMEVNTINDNYHVLDPIDSQLCSVRGIEFVNQAVNYNAVSHTHFITDTGCFKERLKSQLERKINKIYERCEFCKSMSFCSSCLKCLQFCRKNILWEAVCKKIWQVWLALGSNPTVVSDRILPTLQGETTSDKVTASGQ